MSMFSGRKVGLCGLLILGVGVFDAEARPGGKGKTPVMGWNTWCTQNTCGVDWCTSSEVLNVASYIKESGMQALGYDHINLDDCWGERNNVTHKIEGDPVRFPEGMPAFISKLHDMDFKFGLYTDIGPNGCHHPFTGSYPLYQQDADTFKDWGVDYVKFDGCDQPAGFTAEELTCNMSQALLNTGEDIWLNFHCWHTETCAKCGTSFRVGPDHHDNWESTSGIINLLQKRQDFWGPDPTYGWPDPDFVYTGGQGCNSTDPGPDHGNPGPNPPGIRCPGQTNDEYISEFTIWAIAGGSLIISSDPRNMTDFQKKIWFNQEVITIYKDVYGFRDVAMVSDGNPNGTRLDGAVDCALTKQLSHSDCVVDKSFGCFANKTMWTNGGCRGVFVCDGVEKVVCDVDGDGQHVCVCKPGTIPPGPSSRESSQIWARPTSDGGAAVALFNGFSDSPRNLTVDFSTVPKLGWNSATQLKVRDVWEQTDLGSFTGKFSTVVRPHSTVLVKLMSA